MEILTNKAEICKCALYLDNPLYNCRPISPRNDRQISKKITWDFYYDNMESYLGFLIRKPAWKSITNNDLSKNFWCYSSWLVLTLLNWILFMEEPQGSGILDFWNIKNHTRPFAPIRWLNRVSQKNKRSNFKKGLNLASKSTFNQLKI